MFGFVIEIYMVFYVLDLLTPRTMQNGLVLTCFFPLFVFRLCRAGMTSADAKLSFCSCSLDSYDAVRFLEGVFHFDIL